jgi:Protein of unknown function (DUF2808)
MNLYKLTLGVMGAIAAVTGLPSATHALTTPNVLTKQIEASAAESQPVELPAVQTEARANSVVLNQAGQTFFSHPPQVIRAAASQSGAYIPSTYEFTLTLPEDAGQPLQSVTIAQTENLETIRFNLDKSKAFLGQRLTASSELPLASVTNGSTDAPNAVTIVFDQPVEPGSTVTISLAARRNLRWGGVYLFGVTAYPAGENGLGQFLGYQRINFYDNSN